MKNQPIGIIDSGIGGLTVYQEIIKVLPNESVIYIGDSANTPYGAKQDEEIYHLAQRMIKFLIDKQVKLIVIACNTITVTCIERLRNQYLQLPIVGAVPVVKKAAERSQTKRIGILSTTRTATSDAQKALIEKFAHDCEVINAGTDDLVPLIEQGIVSGSRVEEKLEKILAVFQKADVDILALGCTHFPFLQKAIQTILGDNVQLLDSGAAIARQVQRILEHNELLTDANDSQQTFYTTGNQAHMSEMLTILVKKTEAVTTITL